MENEIQSCNCGDIEKCKMTRDYRNILYHMRFGITIVCLIIVMSITAGLFFGHGNVLNVKQELMEVVQSVMIVVYIFMGAAGLKETARVIFDKKEKNNE
jgi:hypothetical protein